MAPYDQHLSKPDRDRLLDEYLVLSAQAGNRAALDGLVRRHHRRFVAHAWRLLGDRDLAEEAVQSSWIEVLKSLKTLKDKRLFAAWAYRIVTRQAGQRIGRIVTDRRLSTGLAQEAIEDADPALPASPGFSRALAALPPQQRAAIALHYYDGLSIPEIAVALAVPAGTIKPA